MLVTFPDGRAESRSTTKNWLLWDQTLPAGTYSWQVKVTGKYKDQSEARKFTIAAKRTGDTWSITVDGKSVSLAGENVTVK